MGEKKLPVTGICLLAIVILFCNTVGKVFAGSISARQERETLKGQLEEVQGLIHELSGSKEDIEEKIARMDQKLTEISEEITELETRLLQKETEITDTQQELVLAQSDVEKQYENMKIRIRFMYENITGSSLEILLSSENIVDFLNRAQYIYQVMQYDRNMLKKYQETVTSVAHMEATLEEEQEELQILRGQVAEEKNAILALMGEKENQLAQVGEELSDARQLALAYEAEIQAQDEMIAMIQAEEARKAEEKARKEAQKQEQQESQNPQEGETEKTEESPETQEPQEPQETEAEPEPEGEDEPQEEEEPEFSGGAFTWPCPSSNRITSDYGPRTAPTSGASSYHRGIDIGAAYGADIVAAAEGSVSFAGYSSSAGNYISVSHGNGIYTVYMHCSSIVAQAGQKVSAGQVIAKVGSTGISTGNHLHFGVSVNGSYVSPWEYLR